MQNTKDVQLQHVHNLESFISQQCKRINHPFAIFFLFGIGIADGDCALYLHKDNLL